MFSEKYTQQLMLVSFLIGNMTMFILTLAMTAWKYGFYPTRLMRPARAETPLPGRRGIGSLPNNGRNGMYKPNLKDAKEWSSTYEKWAFVMDLCAGANEDVCLTDRPSATERRVEQVEKAFSNLLVNTPSPEPSDSTDLTREQYMGISQATWRTNKPHLGEDDSDGRGDWEYEVQRTRRMEEE